MKIAIIGVGYVGLSLLRLFNNKVDVVGYDKSKDRIKQLKKGVDVSSKFLNKKLRLTDKLNVIKECTVYIITLPTPITNKNKPDLNLLISLTKSISKFIKKGNIIIYESTYAPFTTNKIFKKILEKKTKLKEGDDFHLSYSPERINPGTSLKNMSKVTKLVSANNKKIAKIVYKIYKKAFKNVYTCSTIEVAEASKIIENIQRDINIAFFNELSQIFIKLKINPKEVFDSASTKWNFIKMQPGFVGGHCLPVDPYYFTNLLKEKKIKSDFLVSGRKINESYVQFLIEKLKKYFLFNKKAKRILFLGCSYKKNVGDFRTSKSIKIVEHFKNDKTLKVDVLDPYLKKQNNTYKNKINNFSKYDVLIKLVNHDKFKDILKKRILSKKLIDLTNINEVFKISKI